MDEGEKGERISRGKMKRGWGEEKGEEKGEERVRGRMKNKREKVGGGR